MTPVQLTGLTGKPDWHATSHSEKTSVAPPLAITLGDIDLSDYDGLQERLSVGQPNGFASLVLCDLNQDRERDSREVARLVGALQLPQRQRESGDCRASLRHDIDECNQ